MTSPSSTLQHPSPSPHSISQRLLQLSYKCVSKHAKHIFFIASLHGHFSQYSAHKEMAIDKLNNVIDLAYRSKSLELPFVLHERVWGPTNIEKVFNESSLMNALSNGSVSVLAKQIVDVSPRWMHYARDQEMVEDISHWINSLRPEMSHRAA